MLEMLEEMAAQRSSSRDGRTPRGTSNTITAFSEAAGPISFPRPPEPLRRFAAAVAAAPVVALGAIGWVPADLGVVDGELQGHVRPQRCPSDHRGSKPEMVDQRRRRWDERKIKYVYFAVLVVAVLTWRLWLRDSPDKADARPGRTTGND